MCPKLYRNIGNNFERIERDTELAWPWYMVHLCRLMAAVSLVVFSTKIYWYLRSFKYWLSGNNEEDWILKFWLKLSFFAVLPYTLLELVNISKLYNFNYTRWNRRQPLFYNTLNQLFGKSDPIILIWFKVQIFYFFWD